MRLRNVAYAKDKIKAYPEYIKDIGYNETFSVKRFFSDETKPLHLEIGCGKGQFIHTLAQRFPDINFLAIEQYDSVILRALEKMIEHPTDNIFLLRMDAQHLKAALSENSLEKIYLNFSDPWPKVRHEKRRLTHPRFLNIYQTLLKPKGSLELKTDNKDFFAYSLMSLNAYGMRFQFVTMDLHTEHSNDNITTEFEDKFKTEGPIYKLIATFEEEKS